jgi:hypothetical protein
LLDLTLAHRFEVTVKKLIEPAFGDLQFSGGLRGGAEAMAELLQDVANERSTQAFEELRYFFSSQHDSQSTASYLTAAPALWPLGLPPSPEGPGAKGRRAQPSAALNAQCATLFAHCEILFAPRQSET